MRAVGLTGGMGSGKSTVARLLRDRGVPVLDLDQVARDVVLPGTPGADQVRARFGPAVHAADGGIDRPALRALVAQDPQARRDLEALLHPLIREATEAWLEARRHEGAPLAFVEAALLVETGSFRHYDSLVVIDCDPQTQIERVRARSGLSPEEARRWVEAQAPREERLRHAHHVVHNDGAEAELVPQVDALLALLSNGAG